MYFDLNIKGKSYKEDLLILNEASNLKWDYIFLCYNDSNYDNALTYIDDLKNNFENLAIDLRCEISTNNVNHIRKVLNKYRDKSNCISVLGGDLKINRASCENIKIDILSRPYFKRKDCGINHVLAKEAFDNNVTIELCLKDILNSYLFQRSKLLMYFKEIIELHRKFNFPLIISSGGISSYDIKNPVDISYFLKEIGLNSEEIENMICKYPKNIIDFNKDRENYIFKGVKKVEGFD